MRPRHPASLPVDELLADCEITRQRRSGPGGQHRNKVETAIRLQHRPTGVTAEASERRSQSANLAAATRRLRVNLALEVRSESEAVPSTLWQRRRRGGRIAVSIDHEDFPALLAEALDTLAATGWDLRVAAGRLECTSSQLTKLLQKEPRGLQILNRHRQEAGLSPLR